MNIEPDFELNDKQKGYLRGMMARIEMLANDTQDWIDPKFICLLELAFRILEEQVALDKFYETEESDGDSFLDRSNIPSAEELNKLLDGMDE